MSTGIPGIGLVSCLALALGTSGLREAAGMPYPGIMPGATMLVSRDAGVVASNQAICAVWRVKSPGLKLEQVGDVQIGKSLAFTGELFEVVLANGSRYPASALTPLSAPRVRNIEPKPLSARLASRSRGRLAELPMRSADGGLRVTWRVMACSQANYLRQEIEIATASDGCVVREIKWLDQSIAAARVSGQVNGSPLVADNFFLGCEDPHASNLAGSDGEVSCRMLCNVRCFAGKDSPRASSSELRPKGSCGEDFLITSKKSALTPIALFSTIIPGTISR